MGNEDVFETIHRRFKKCVLSVKSLQLLKVSNPPHHAHFPSVHHSGMVSGRRLDVPQTKHMCPSVDSLELNRCSSIPLIRGSLKVSLDLLSQSRWLTPWH